MSRRVVGCEVCGVRSKKVRRIEVRPVGEPDGAVKRMAVCASCRCPDAVWRRQLTEATGAVSQ